MNRCRERWVHQHDTGHDAGIQMVVDVHGIEPGRGNGGKKLREDAGTALGKFVENERGAGEFSKDGKKAGAGRRFQNDVAEVTEGQECGIVLENYPDVKAGDIIEPYEVEQVARRLTLPSKGAQSAERSA